MQLYLPIAELTVNMFLFLGMGGAVGFLSGMFGVGGGFLLTPLLIFTGIPPAVAVATVTPQIVASSTSAAISYWRRRLIDEKMTALLGARRPRRLGGRRLRLPRAPLGRPARPHHRARLRRLPRLHRHDHAAGIGARAVARALRPRRASARPRPSQLDPRPAAEDAVPPLEALCERDPDHRARRRHRLSRHRCSASAAASSWCRR